MNEIDDLLSNLFSDKIENPVTKDTIKVEKCVNHDIIDLPEIVSSSYKEETPVVIEKPVIVSQLPVKKVKPFADKTMISQSLITKMFDHGNLKTYCRYYINRLYIEKDVVTKTTDSMKYGLYGEQQMIGGSAHDNTTIVLNRNKRSCKDKAYLQNNDDNCEGCSFINQCKKTSTQEKIDMQAEIFKKKCEDMGIDIHADINTQLTIYKRFPHEPEFIINGTMDVFPAFIFIDDEIKLSLFDIKITQKISDSYGYQKWGDPANLDFIQLNMYLYLLKDIDFSINTHLSPGQILILKFAYHYIQNNLIHRFYWVFEHGSKMEDLKDVMINVDDYQPWSKNVENELHEIIRTTINEIKNNNVMGLWDVRTPCYMCSTCPFKDDCEEFYNYKPLELL